jgi:hypothetical protein
MLSYHFVSGETYCIGGRMGLISFLDTMEERKISASSKNQTMTVRLFSVQPSQ